MITLRDVSMKYEGSNQSVLENINLTLPDKGLIFIVGESGSGKSTLLNLIAGFIKPISGNILFNDKDITKYSNSDMHNYLTYDISFIHQSYDLINYITVDDNIRLKNGCYDEKMLNKLKISKLKNKVVKNLSGGEKERVAIARALVNSSRVILADEPTGALDSINSKKIIKLLKKISESRLVVVVTHDKNLIKYGDKTIRIKDGKIIGNVEKSEVINIECDNNRMRIKKDIISLVYKNLLYKYKRNILTILAFSIGLITLLLVLSISKGFNIALDESEKTTLASYPITISENSYNIDNSFEDLFSTSNDNDYVTIIPEVHKNNIDEKFIDFINSLEYLTTRIEYTYLIDDVLFTSTNSSIYEELDLISGRMVENKNEMLLLIDSNNQLSHELAMILNLQDKTYDYKELLNLKLKVLDDEYKIVGIVKGKEDSFYLESTGLYTTSTFLDVPLSMNIIPKDYESKLELVKHLKDYGGIEFTDYASSIKRLSVNVIDAITVILILFSGISLIITSFMIGIITYISVLERVRDIGILKSIGYTNFEVKKIFYLENIIIALISSIVSIMTIYMISIPINNILNDVIGFENILLIDSINMIYIILLSIFISLLGSMLPIRKIKKMNIINALNYE